MRSTLITVLCVLFIVLCISCSDSIGLDVDQTGSLRVVLLSQTKDAIPVYVPSISMNNAYFIIQGNGPSGSSVGSGYITSSTCEFSNMEVGVWEISVIGYNQDFLPISRYDFQTVIRKNSISTEEVVLSPIEGTGYLDFFLNWPNPSEIMSDPHVQLSFEAANSEIFQRDVNLSETTLNTASQLLNLKNGWYLVTASLFEGTPSDLGNLPWAQTVFSIRIVANETTFVSISLTEDDLAYQGTGSSSVVIRENMKNEFSVSYAGSSDRITTGDTIVLWAQSSHSDNAKYRWYVNGQLQLGDNNRYLTYTFLTQGTYHIALFVIDNGAICGYQDMYTANPPIFVDAISIDQSDSFSGYTGLTYQLTAAVSPWNATNTNVSWNSSNTDIAVVDQAGSVTLKDQGVVVITANAEGGFGVSDSIVITSRFANIGDTGPAGGKIFYVDTYNQYNDWTYLEFAPHNSYVELPWGHDGRYVTETESAVNHGASNTTRIIDYFGYSFRNFMGYTDYAAKYCDEYSLNDYDDWFLPSLEELQLLAMHSYQLGLWGLGNGGGTPAWSSTADGYDNAYMVYLGSQSVYSWGRWEPCLVFPIRKF